jgi:hypothetical protein
MDLVYFLYDRAAGRVKIGHSITPHTRRTDISRKVGRQLEIVGAMYGGRSKEMELHKHFADLRIEGEWFQVTIELAEFIAINAFDFDEYERQQEILRRRIRNNPFAQAAAILTLLERIENKGK